MRRGCTKKFLVPKNRPGKTHHNNVCYDDAVILTTPKMKNEIRRSRKGVKITSAGKAAYNDAVINR